MREEVWFGEGESTTSGNDVEQGGIGVGKLRYVWFFWGNEGAKQC